jgi:isopenicillin-N epimerase
VRELRNELILDEEVIFLNHGSFGACPRKVFRTYQEFQKDLERQPVEFLSRRAPELLANARKELADFINVDPNNVVYFPNPTTAINMVVRNLDLQPGDEILTTDHEYGAMDRTWRFICQRTGATYNQKPIPLPVTDQSDFVETFWSGVSSRTKVIFLSHITSPTALIFPVERICDRARQSGIISIIDGAHSPGQIPLDLELIDADIYTGACHKWLCAPKGAAFLYAHTDIQPILDPLVVSWGYESEKPGPSQYIDYHEWQGTRDLAASLSVPSAIRFQQGNNWDKVQVRCHELASQARERINSLTGLEPISPNSTDWFAQMVAVRLPRKIIPESFKEHLHKEYNIEVLAHYWNDQPLLRICCQAYNGQSDLDELFGALDDILT